MLAQEETNNTCCISKNSCNTSKPYSSALIINSTEYHKVVNKLRNFFLSKNFIEVSTQNRLSILAACEDPFNVGCFNYANQKWPLPQTGQMWLEYELLTKPDVAGYFCLTTSYREEENPVEGRHDIIFPLFEFETAGGIEELINLEKELLTYLGYDANKFLVKSYTEIADEFNTHELDHDDETRLYTDYSPTYFIKDFPEFTSPFWNMKRDKKQNSAKKVDVILSGQETIGSAEREDDIFEMKKRFDTIMDGRYKEKLYELFGKDRTDSEMEDYLKLKFFKRCGGGIGVTRLMRSMKLENLI